MARNPRNRLTFARCSKPTDPVNELENEVVSEHAVDDRGEVAIEVVLVIGRENVCTPFPRMRCRTGHMRRNDDIQYIPERGVLVE